VTYDVFVYEAVNIKYEAGPEKWFAVTCIIYIYILYIYIL
jgi:hypothetical protein